MVDWSTSSLMAYVRGCTYWPQSVWCSVTWCRRGITIVLLKHLNWPPNAGVTCNHIQCFSAQTDSDCHKELGHELWLLIRQQNSCNSVEDDPAIHKSRLLRSMRLLLWPVCPWSIWCEGISKQWRIDYQTFSWVTDPVRLSPQTGAGQRLETEVMISGDGLSSMRSASLKDGTDVYVSWVIYGHCKLQFSVLKKRLSRRWSARRGYCNS